jgi:pyruvate/2-oxoglutarate dehydrogenase complex dihydrolipoamide acyltransferase (E2) component
MKRLIKEVAALLCVLLVAGGVVLAITRTVAAPSTVDTFTGRVDKIPLQILSPVAGQVLTIPQWEGAQVQQGQVLATIQVFDRNFRPPADSRLFKLQGDTLQVISPATGVIGKLAVAPLSVVSGSGFLMHLFTVESTELEVLMPVRDELSAYRAFYMAAAQSTARFRIRIEGIVPTDVVGNVPPSTTVYRAKCDRPADCEPLLTQLQVLIYALKASSG